jgi:hypothetical protein
MVRDLFFYLAPVLPATLSGLSEWYKWRKEEHRVRRYVTLSLIVASVIVAWAVLFFATRDNKAQLEQAHREAAAQAERIERLQTQLQDLGARLEAGDRRLQILAKAIPDPKLREEAEAIHTELQRGAVEQVQIEATATVEVKQAQRRGPLIHWPLAFWGIAVVFSLCFGIYAVRIFVSQEQTKKDWTWWFYQGWFNFAGAITGWSALYLLIVKFGRNYPDSVNQLTFLDLVIVLIAFIGITGHLPYAVMGLITSLADLFAKALEKVSHVSK